MIELASALGNELVLGGKLWLFLDYDGTLAEFAPTPDTIIPNQELITLMTRLAQYPDRLRVVIMSGRRFSHIEKLLPVPGLLEAGTYGIEFKTWEGEQVSLLDFATDRPYIDQIKAQWMDLTRGRTGYYIEDKGYSLALHARFAPEEEARGVLVDASKMAQSVVERGTFRILGGNQFIEVAPLIADKGQSVGSLLKRFPWLDAKIVYIGDDDKDEEAFKVVLKYDGIPIVVSENERPTLAQRRLKNPREVRQWLTTLAETLERGYQANLHPVSE